MHENDLRSPHPLVPEEDLLGKIVTGQVGYCKAWATLNPTQKARVKLKQGWEQCSARAVFADWPGLFDPDREQDRDELVACRKLIAERPDLFPAVVEND